MNTARYATKHVMQKVLAFTRLVGAQEFVKQITGRWNAQLPQEFFDKRIANKIRVINKLNLAPNAHVMEQGTGWYGLDPILFYLCGSECINTFDTMRWLKKSLLLKSVHACIRNAEKIKSEMQGSSVDIDERFDRLRELTEAWKRLRLAELLQRINVKYHCTRSVDRNSIASNSVDLFYTDSVLQRIVPSELVRLVRESHRILRNGGVSYHVVDCKDFHSIGNKSVPECWYLTISPVFYTIISSQYVNYQNRLRMPEFVEMFSQASYTRVDVIAKTLKPENVRFCIQNRNRISATSCFHVDEVAVSGFTLVARK